MMKKFAVVLILLVLSGMLIAAAPPVESDLPNYYFIDMRGRAQSMPLSCESRSASDLAAYWGVPIEETDFFNTLPKSDNPEKGFVGDVYGTWGQVPPNPYGVHAKPVAQLLRQNGLEAKAHKGLTFEQLRKEIANDRPVIVWVIGRVWEGTPVEYIARDGSQTTVARYEHTMIVYGYDLAAVYLIDAGSGARQQHSIQNFEKSWAVLGNMAVTVAGTKPKPANPNRGDIYVVQPGDYLAKLASEWGLSWQELAALNDLTYPYIIYAGQVLYTGLDLQSLPTPKPPKAPTSPPPPSKPQPAATPAASPSGPPASQTAYTVQRGDHLMQIARDFELEWKEIAALNGLSYPYLLYPGQTLHFPTAGSSSAALGEGTSTGTYTVRRGDHLMKIARKLGLSWRGIAELNNLAYPYLLQPGQVLQLPGSTIEPVPQPALEVTNNNGVKTYTVQQGDYIHVIARQFGVSWQLLASINGLSYPYSLQPGQVLVIP